MNELGVGKKIRRLREKKAWTQEHLAQAAGISLRTVQRAADRDDVRRDARRPGRGARRRRGGAHPDGAVVPECVPVLVLREARLVRLAGAGLEPGSPPSGTHDVSFYCDDIAKTVRELRDRGVEFVDGIEDHGYGLVTHFVMPGDVNVQLYEPRYDKKKG